MSDTGLIDNLASGHGSPARGLADAEQLLRRLSTVTEILRGWIWETDAEHRFTYMSDSVEHFAGRPPEWHYGKTRQDLGNLNAINAEHQKLLQQLENHETFGPIEFVRNQNGQQLWMRTIGQPQFDSVGRFLGYCGIAFDITSEVDARQVNRRVEPRKRVARSATIAAPGMLSAVPCIVLDISLSGARLHVHHESEVPNQFTLLIELDGQEHACQVAWRRENAIGVHFTNR